MVARTFVAALVLVLLFSGCGGGKDMVDWVGADRCAEWLEKLETGEWRLSPDQIDAVEEAFPRRRSADAATELVNRYVDSVYDTCVWADRLGLVGSDGSLSSLAIHLLPLCGNVEPPDDRGISPELRKIFEDTDRRAAQESESLRKSLRKQLGEKRWREMLALEAEERRMCLPIYAAVGPTSALMKPRR